MNILNLVRNSFLLGIITKDKAIENIKIEIDYNEARIKDAYDLINLIQSTKTEEKQHG